ncbi:septum formation inhibitor Maf [Campylobacter pinnipediorum]|uniref:septum formation inhibitor Maf n=1 Tax=Campylobacter pinnipediorum TaxID=1965231 RepID=UPI00084DB309|nr:septum formation inhibitor Maf [Campylobacter pinnipediorum]AQW82335.1 septum formation protein Maf [Campylobacter pinnipediorum subsp. pinnipediorum]
MIILASSSQTRAKILQEYNIKFKQISFDFDESMISRDLQPHTYVLNVVKTKKEQFLSAHKGLKNLLFADSCVVCNGRILGKATDEHNAIQMLEMQSGNSVSVVTAMAYVSEKFELISTSETIYKFKQFDQQDMLEYIKSKEYIDKAGAMMVDGFNKKYILTQNGTTDNARGLNVSILKAFL